MPVKNLVVILVSAIISLICYETAIRNRFASTFVEALEIVENESLDEYSQRELFNAAMNGMLQAVDEHSEFIDPEAAQAFMENLNQEFAGIGITAGINPQTKELFVLSPTVDTPAYRAGIQAGDVIEQVDGKITKGLDINKSVTMMRGLPNTDVRLTLRRHNVAEPFDVTLTRQIILIDSVLGYSRNSDGTWNYLIDEQPHIAYIRLASFGERSAKELSTTLEQVVPQCDALILDLRENPGGLLGAAVEIADMFLDEGMPIVSTRGRDGDVRDSYTAHSNLTLVPRQMPVIVLTNRFSASASEILSACLQDHERAIIIGERTWGKGTVQNVIELENGRSVMKLTTASYWRPNGKNIHRRRDMKPEDDWGVIPDDGMLIDLTIEQLQAIATERRKRDYPGALLEDPVSGPINDTGDPADVPSNSDDTNPPVNGQLGPEIDPSLEGAGEEGQSVEPSNVAPQDTTEESHNESLIEIDPHLKRAIEVINQKLGRAVVIAP